MDEKTLEWLYLDSDSLTDFDYIDMPEIRKENGDDEKEIKRD